MHTKTFKDLLKAQQNNNLASWCWGRNRSMRHWSERGRRLVVAGRHWSAGLPQTSTLQCQWWKAEPAVPPICRLCTSLQPSQTWPTYSVIHDHHAANDTAYVQELHQSMFIVQKQPNIHHYNKLAQSHTQSGNMILRSNGVTREWKVLNSLNLSIMFNQTCATWDDSAEV